MEQVFPVLYKRVLVCRHRLSSSFLRKSDSGKRMATVTIPHPVPPPAEDAERLKKAFQGVSITTHDSLPMLSLFVSEKDVCRIFLVLRFIFPTSRRFSVALVIDREDRAFFFCFRRSTGVIGSLF